MSQELFIITVYCLVDDIFSEIIKKTGKLRGRGFASQLHDVEVITMEIVGEFFGIDADKGIWEYFRGHWSHFFPRISERCNFARQAANLQFIKQQIQKRLADQIRQHDEGFLVDGVPIPVCHLKRASQSNLFRGEAAHGYCATKEEFYYGFKGLVVTTLSGVIVDYTVTASNIDEREAFLDCAETVRGTNGIGDKGFLGKTFKQNAQDDFGITIHTLSRSNMKDDRPREFLYLIMKTRRLIETVIGQLTERFHFNCVRARNLFRLGNRFCRKILSHTIGVFLLRRLGYDDLKLERLVAT